MSGKPFVPVVDKDGKPLMPCTGKRARLLLERNRARIYKRMPFVIQLKNRSQDNCELQILEVKIDPGSKTTGMAIVRKHSNGDISVIQLFDLVHRGDRIKLALIQRATYRRNRRSRNTRYRQPRFLNRTRPKGWLPPSLQHRVDTTLSQVRRFMRYYPIAAIVLERVKFDTQALQNPEISGIEYQQGTLYGYEIREYLLEKWGRSCAYCGTKNVSRFEIDHIYPRSRGGSNRVSNLALSCKPCNQTKANRDIHEFLRHDPSHAESIIKYAYRPLKDTAAVNATRNKLLLELLHAGLAVETSTGGMTKYNRCRLDIPKTHVLDAVCTGVINKVYHWQRRTTVIKAVGRGKYKRTISDKYGFPKYRLSRSKRHYDFATGDIVKVSRREYRYVGRVSVRASGKFNLQTLSTIHVDIAPTATIYKKCKLLQKADGYYYHQQSLESYRFNMLSI